MPRDVSPSGALTDYLGVDMDKVITRLNAMGTRDTETGCLRWTGAKNPKGYGRQWADGRVQQVHRLAYEAWIGPIPDGHEIDHVYERGCRHRDCYEPTHLEAVTHSENIKRTTTSRGAKTHCSKGHEYTTENTSYYNTQGYVGRTCRTCKSLQNKNRNRSRRG